MSAGTQEPVIDDQIVDLEPIIPDRATLTIQGVPVRVSPLRLRETFSIARVIAVGLGAGLLDMEFAWDDPEELKGQIGAMLLLAVPSAEDQILVFLRDIVKPVNPDDKGRLTNIMTNPYPTDVLDILDAVLDAEGDNLASLVGKARLMAPKVAKLIPTRPGPDARGPEPSTSSQPSTDGPTTTSSASPSAG